jgi:hypothetical protein
VREQQETQGTGVEPQIGESEPLEPIVRQLDIASQTQQILEHRLTKVEQQYRLLVDSLGERQRRTAEQLDLLQRQLEQNTTDHKEEVARLNQSVTLLLKQQSMIMDRLGTVSELK